MDNIEVKVVLASSFIDSQFIFKDLSMHLKNRDILFVTGKNGCGKTTFIKSLCGIHRIESGSILFNKISIYKQNCDLKNNIVYIGHKNSLHNDLTVSENLKYLSEFDSSIYKKNLSQEICKLLDFFNLQKYKNYMVSKISEGNKKKVSLSRLFLTKKKIWLLDEPLSFLDDDTKNLLEELILRNRDFGGITIASTHTNFLHKIKDAIFLDMNT